MPAARIRAARTSTWLAVLAVAGGSLTLIGWMLGIPQLADWFGLGIPQLPNNALATAAAGGAWWLLHSGRRGAAVAPLEAALGRLRRGICW